jgi:hypothetical protein
MFLWQQRIVEGIAFYAVHVMSKERRQLVLARASCYYVHFKQSKEFKVPKTAV